MKLHKNLFFLLFILLARPLVAQIDTENESRNVNRHNLALFDVDDESQVIELVAKYVEYRKNKDTEMLTTLFIEDANQLVSSGEWRLDREAMVKGMGRSTNANPGDRSIEVERVRFISEEVAIADARYSIKGRDGNPDRNMWSTFVTVLRDGKWKIAAIRNMLPARRPKR